MGYLVALPMSADPSNSSASRPRVRQRTHAAGYHEQLRVIANGPGTQVRHGQERRKQRRLSGAGIAWLPLSCEKLYQAKVGQDKHDHRIG